MTKRLALAVLAAALLAPGAGAAPQNPDYGMPRAMPSDYAASHGVLPRVMPSDYARAGVNLTPPAGMPRAMPSDYEAYFGSQRKPVGAIDWPSAGVRAGIALAALLAAALAVALIRRNDGMRHLTAWRRLVALLVAVVTVAALAGADARTARASAPQTPIVTACPAGFERLAVSSLEAQGPYVLPRLVDTAGNNNGYVCGLALPYAMGDAWCAAFGGPACGIRELGLPLYQFKDDANPASA